LKIGLWSRCELFVDFFSIFVVIDNIGKAKFLNFFD